LKMPRLIQATPQLFFVAFINLQKQEASDADKSFDLL